MNETRHIMPSSSRSNYFPDMSDYVMPSASRSNYFPDMSENMMLSSSRSMHSLDMSDNIMPSSSRSNSFADMSDYVMPSSSRSMHFPDMSDNMMPSSSRSNYFSDMSDNIMPSSSINTFSPMTHTTLKMEGSSTPIHASTVSDQPMSTAITTIETTTGSTAGNANFPICYCIYILFSLLLVVRGVMSCLCVCLRVVLCFRFAFLRPVFPMLPVSLCCPFLISPNVHLLE